VLDPMFPPEPTLGRCFFGFSGLMDFELAEGIGLLFAKFSGVRQLPLFPSRLPSWSPPLLPRGFDQDSRCFFGFPLLGLLPLFFFAPFHWMQPVRVVSCFLGFPVDSSRPVPRPHLTCYLGSFSSLIGRLSLFFFFPFSLLPSSF